MRKGSPPLRGGSLRRSELVKQSRRRAARRKPAVGALPRRAYAAPLARFHGGLTPRRSPASTAGLRRAARPLPRRAYAAPLARFHGGLTPRRSPASTAGLRRAARPLPRRAYAAPLARFHGGLTPCRSPSHLFTAAQLASFASRAPGIPAAERRAAFGSLAGFSPTSGLILSLASSTSSSTPSAMR